MADKDDEDYTITPEMIKAADFRVDPFRVLPDDLLDQLEDNGVSWWSMWKLRRSNEANKRRQQQAR